MDKQNNVTDFFKKVDESYTITNCHNGFMVEVSGQDKEDEYVRAKYVLLTIEEVKQMVVDLAGIPRT